MNKKLTASICGVSMLALSSVASAAPVVDITAMSSTWFDGAPIANVTYEADNGTTSSTASWGTGGNTSSYNFATAATPISNDLGLQSPSDLFDLGEFTHNNFPINAGSSITGISLRLDAAITIDGDVQAPLAFLFDFDHEETPNNANPCAYGGDDPVNANGCADRVVITVALGSETFEVDGKTYTLALSADTDTFLTAEGQANTFTIQGFWTLAEEVSEPSILALMGLGLVGMGVARRRRTLKA